MNENELLKCYVFRELKIIKPVIFRLNIRYVNLKNGNVMNITLQQSFSVSETETGIKNRLNIYPDNQSIISGNRLFITCGGNSNQTLIAGQVVCDAIQTYFHSFLENKNEITPDFIEKSIRFGEISLDEFRKENPEMINASGTLCLIYFASDCVYFSQIGESHIYQIRDNRIIYKSVESSLERKIRGTAKPVEVNIVKLKDIQAQDQFFIYAGELSGFQEEEFVCQILSKNIPPESKLSRIKEIYLDKTKSCFSAHLIPIRNIDEAFNLKGKLSSLLYSFI
jgi:hypothetical protein